MKTWLVVAMLGLSVSAAAADCGGWVLFGRGPDDQGLFAVGPPQPWVVAATEAECEEAKAHNVAAAKDVIGRGSKSESFMRWAVALLQAAEEQRCARVYTWSHGTLVMP